MARVMIALDEPEQAVGWADRKPWPRRDRVREALLADAMHLSGQEHEAHAIYARLCAALPGGLGSLLGQGRQGFDALLSQASGAIPSPVFAISLLEAIADRPYVQRWWDMAEAEFYDSPYFRLMHAHHLDRQGQQARGLTKLLVLVQEMPRVKAAAEDLHSALETLDPSGSGFDPRLRESLRERARKCGWKVGGKLCAERHDHAGVRQMLGAVDPRPGARGTADGGGRPG